MRWYSPPRGASTPRFSHSASHAMQHPTCNRWNSRSSSLIVRIGASPRNSPQKLRPMLRLQRPRARSADCRRAAQGPCRSEIAVRREVLVRRGVRVSRGVGARALARLVHTRIPQEVGEKLFAMKLVDGIVVGGALGRLGV